MADFQTLTILAARTRTDNRVGTSVESVDWDWIRGSKEDGEWGVVCSITEHYDQEIYHCAKDLRSCIFNNLTVMGPPYKR